MDIHCLENVKVMFRPTARQHPKIGVVITQAALLVRVLARCRSKHHLNILEAMYIHVLKPVLCKQKSFVANLTLFKHAHSTHSHKHTEQSVTHVHTSTPFTHIHTTLTIDSSKVMVSV